MQLYVRVQSTPRLPYKYLGDAGRDRITDTLIGLTFKAPVASLPRKKEESDIAPSRARRHDVAIVEILFNRCRLEYMAEIQVRRVEDPMSTALNGSGVALRKGGGWVEDRWLQLRPTTKPHATLPCPTNIIKSETVHTYINDSPDTGYPPNTPSTEPPAHQGGVAFFRTGAFTTSPADRNEVSMDSSNSKTIDGVSSLEARDSVPEVRCGPAVEWLNITPIPMVKYLVLSLQQEMLTLYRSSEWSWTNTRCLNKICS